MERRIAVLERPQSGIDPLEVAISKLNDNELGLIEEYRSLCKAGFNVEQVREMMGDESYQMAVDSIQKVDQELERLTAPPMGKAAKTKKRKKIDVDHVDHVDLDSDTETDNESEC